MYDNYLLEILFRSLGAFFFLMAVILTGFFVVPYTMLRKRNMRSGFRDRLLGMKVVLHFLFTMSIAIAWLGMTFIVTSLVMETSSDMMRQVGSGIGASVAGLMMAFLFHRLIRSTNDNLYPSVHKAYITMRLVVSGFIVLSAFTMLGSMTFESLIAANGGGWTGYPYPSSSSSSSSSNSSQWDELKQLLAVSLIWFVAAAIDYRQLQTIIRKPELPPYEDLCLKCDYPLTGSIISQGISCPECGSEIPDQQSRIISMRHQHRQEQTQRETPPDA